MCIERELIVAINSTLAHEAEAAIRYKVCTRPHVAQSVQDLVVFPRLLQAELIRRDGEDDQVIREGCGRVR